MIHSPTTPYGQPNYSGPAPARPRGPPASRTARPSPVPATPLDPVKESPMDLSNGRTYYAFMARFYIDTARRYREDSEMHAYYLNRAGERRRMALFIVANPNRWES